MLLEAKTSRASSKSRASNSGRQSATLCSMLSSERIGDEKFEADADSVSGIKPVMLETDLLLDSDERLDDVEIEMELFAGLFK